MNKHSLGILVETIILVCLGSLWRAALSATAIATITVNIVESTTGIDGLALSSRELDLQGKYHDELTIMNRSDNQRVLIVELIPLSGTSAACNLKHSPRVSSLPPGGYQVVRLILQDRSDGSCKLKHELIISDARKPEVPLFNVPVHRQQAFTGKNNSNQ